ncbi:hypothetical protein CYMTET_34926 [Cymbomonas tetramitiformis]|uniref:Heterokaryon incompatibility domain-containing protein n=1 Tax=Cymbomonas tetramitiformis TaxID=36881 RepID=A0AAE0FAA5_9CHLO|nr:hypothetical protein CYMTET_34926 [Cymbomonas tetramitiformis]
MVVEARGVTIQCLYSLFCYTGYWKYDARHTRVRSLVPQFVAWAHDQGQLRSVQEILCAMQTFAFKEYQATATPSVFVSYSWDMTWHEVVNALKQMPGSLHDTAVWLDVLCINQHQGECTAAELPRLERAISTCGATVVLIDAKALALRRVWCLFEILKTVTSDATLRTMFTCPVQSHMTIYAVLVVAGRFTGAVDIQTQAQATFEDDRVRILAEIENMMGFTKANRCIEQALLEGANGYLKESALRGFVRKPRVTPDGQKHMTGFCDDEILEMVTHAQELGMPNIVDQEGCPIQEGWDSLEKIVRGRFL